MEQKWEQIGLEEDNPEYQAFVDKYKPKKTTDDCYTPPAVYDAIRDWACKEYGISQDKIVRPFYPGGDYKRFQYQPDSVVLDNPPFSILTQIVTFYIQRGIPFFLFAPSLTIFSSSKVLMRCNHILCGADIKYHNGAVIGTGFVTSYGGDEVARTAPELGKAIKSAQNFCASTIPKYEYPAHVITGAALSLLSKYGVDFRVTRGECVPIGKLDSQIASGKRIFGGGLLMSDKSAERHMEAERRMEDNRRMNIFTWTLSQRERSIIENLD